MNDYNNLLEQSLDLKRKRDDKYKEISKDRLYQIAKKKMQTTILGALDTIEQRLGFLWTAEDLSSEQIQLKSIFENARSEILDRGNTQIRNLETEMVQYDITWKRYTISLPVLDKGEEDGE